MDRAEKAKNYFLEGYNCAQAVALAFSDILNMDERQVALLTSGYGGGMGRMREVCGSVSGAVFVISALYGYDDPKEFDGKKQLYANIQEFCSKFKEENGSIICRELLGIDGASIPTPDKRTEGYYKKRPCAELVECSAKILDEFIKNRQ